MNITIISPLDIAHQPSLLWRGFNEYTKHKCRYIVLKESYLGYPTDILYGKVEPYEIIEILSKTDFYIFTTHIAQFGFYDLARRLNRNNHLVITYGSEVRRQPANYLMAWLRTDLMILTSHDYSQSSQVGFSAQHIPISINFNEIPERQPPGDDVIRLVHSPTAPKVKGTEHFVKAVEKLKKKHKDLKIEAVLIEGKPWTECLQEKSRCDVFYDQFSIGSYGMGTVESWAMRLPVVGRANAWLRSWYPDVPILDVHDAKSLQKRLEDLILHADLREEAGRRGRMFAEQNHDLQKNIRKLNFLVKSVTER